MPGIVLDAEETAEKEVSGYQEADILVRQQAPSSINDLETMELIFKCPLRFSPCFGDLIRGRLMRVLLLQLFFLISL